MLTNTTRLIAFSLILSLLTGCGEKKNNNIAKATSDLLPEPFRIEIDIDKLSEDGAPVMSDIIDSLEYVKLEENEEFLIRSVSDRPYISDDYILVDCDMDVGLLQYTRSGKFIRKIGARGNGPGEYLQLRGFKVDEAAGMIYTIPNWKNQVDKYDLSTGRYLGGIPLTEADGSPIIHNKIRSIYPLLGNVMVSAAVGEAGRGQPAPIEAFTAFDISTGRITHYEQSKLYGTTGKVLTAPSILWYDDRGRLNFMESLNDTLFVIAPDYSMSPKAIINLGADKVNFKSYQDIRSLADYNGKIIIGDIKETPRYIIIYVSKSLERQYAVAFDKMTGKSSLLSEISRSSEEWKKGFFFHGLRNDIDGGLSFFMTSYDKDTWFSSFYAYQLIDALTAEHFAKIKSEMKYPERMERLQKLVSTLTTDDNPVIVIAHIKKGL